MAHNQDDQTSGDWTSLERAGGERAERGRDGSDPTGCGAGRDRAGGDTANGDTANLDRVGGERVGGERVGAGPSGHPAGGGRANGDPAGRGHAEGVRVPTDADTDVTDSTDDGQSFGPAGCPIRWLVGDVGRFLSDDEAPDAEADDRARQALGRAAHEVEDLLRSAFAAHEVVATELRLAGPVRGYRRTVLPSAPGPAALLLLALRMCDPGDDVSILQHTAGYGTVTRTGTWPFGMAQAEWMTRPPERDTVPLPGALAPDDQ